MKVDVEDVPRTDISDDEPLMIDVGIYRVSSSDRTPKGHRSQLDHRSIHHYFVRG